MTDQHTVSAANSAASWAHSRSAPPPLRRGRRTKVIAGVCGGLGRHYDIDPVIFRCVAAVLAVAGGVGLLAYGFAWLLIPLDGEDENEARRLLSGRVEGSALTALLCSLAGCGLLLSMLGNARVLAFALALSFATAGAAYWSQHRRRADLEAAVAQPVARSAAHAAAHGPAVGHEGAPPETTAPPVPGSPSWWRDPITKDGTSGTTGIGYLRGPGAVPYAKGPAPARGRGRREGPWIGGWTFLLAMAAAAAGILATWHSQPVGTSLEIGFGCALAVFGAGLALSAWFGRAGWGLLVPALLTCLLLAGAAGLPKSIGTEWSRAQWQPASASAVRPRYQLGSGVGTLDLSRVRLRTGQVVTTRATMGAGRLKVVVPADAAVRLTARAGLGDVRLPGDRPEDVDVVRGQRRELTLEPPRGTTARGTFALRLEAAVGQVEVVRATP